MTEALTTSAENVTANAVLFTANAELFAALAKAQNDFKPIAKNRKNSHLNTRYADLNSVLDAVRPALNANDLFLWQTVNSATATITVETFIGHKSGAVLSSGPLTMPAVVTQKGINNVQAFGSTETYARRYSLTAFLGVAADDDTDGNGPDDKPETKPEPKPEDLFTEADLDAGRAAAAQGREAYIAWGEGLRRRPKALAAYKASGWEPELWAKAKEVTAAQQGAQS